MAPLPPAVPRMEAQKPHVSSESYFLTYSLIYLRKYFSTLEPMFKTLSTFGPFFKSLSPFEPFLMIEPRKGIYTAPLVARALAYGVEKHLVVNMWL